ncbi:hypothetical protein [Flavobacterium lindanitolerans]|uniref:hypothetical protein n=1 Tax=Flavobacterium lindanitolerans TaxID=428988 RepID=UPI0023F03E78|nr:hypothetical protein [Flavobacterium lindanitolerans]
MNNLSFFSTAMQFLLLISSYLTQQLQTDIQRGSCTLDDQILELKKEITGGGTIDLIDANAQKLDGICSFDKNSLNVGRAFIFDQLALGYATHATDSGLAGKLSYNTAAPKELQNAVFILSQDGREVLRMPIRDINNIGTGTNAEEEYKQLKSLRYLVDNREIKIQIKFPEGVTLDNTKKHYVYLRLSGVQTTKKANA